MPDGESELQRIGSQEWQLGQGHHRSHVGRCTETRAELNISISMPSLRRDNYGTSCSGQTAVTKIGDAPRTAPYQLWNPSSYRLDASLRRTFNITPERGEVHFYRLIA